MSDSKQAILLKKHGVSNRGIAEQLGINRMTFSLLPVKDKLMLNKDRTNWKFGTFDVNNLMLGITH